MAKIKKYFVSIWPGNNYSCSLDYSNKTFPKRSQVDQRLLTGTSEHTHTTLLCCLLHTGYLSNLKLILKFYGYQLYFCTVKRLRPFHQLQSVDSCNEPKEDSWHVKREKGLESFCYFARVSDVTEHVTDGLRWLCFLQQCHEVHGLKEAVQRELTTVWCHGRDRAVLCRTSWYAVSHQEPAVQASSNPLVDAVIFYSCFNEEFYNWKTFN